VGNILNQRDVEGNGRYLQKGEPMKAQTQSRVAESLNGAASEAAVFKLSTTSVWKW
jgi:hypothetical protein